MKKSAHVPAVMIIALAAGLEIGCSSRRDCVENLTGRTVADSVCTANKPGYHWITRSTSRSGFGTSGTTGSSIGS